MKDIRSNFLKEALLLLLDQSTHVLNQLFATGVVPKIWKEARVAPITKSGDLKDVNNWRLISLLSVVSKIAEKCMHSHLTECLEKSNLLSDRQFGYRSGLGTGDAIFNLASDLYENRDKSEVTAICYIDLRKAFDSVDHSYLLDKLKKLKLQKCEFSWLVSYLTDRTQYTQVGDFESSKENVSYGVPQGSVLGPLLFIYYIDNLGSDFVNCKSLMYADDLVFYCSDKCAATAVANLQVDLQKVVEKCTELRLTINRDKTKFMLSGSKGKSQCTYETYYRWSGSEQSQILLLPGCKVWRNYDHGRGL